jgi:tRNA(Ile)-lysidine synthase
VARANSASKIALGHNRDDQAETVLMRFLRGSGISGLRGIPATREMGGCLIIRPLIELHRRQIEDFLNKKDIPFCTDSSNLKSIYLRNRIRNQLLPSLEKSFNPNIREMLVSFAENVSADFDFLERQGQERFKSVRVNSGNNDVVISLKKVSLLHKALQKLVARLAIKELKGNVRRIDYRHWKELEDLLEERPGGSIVDLPGGVSVVKRGQHLVFYARH